MIWTLSLKLGIGLLMSIENISSWVVITIVTDNYHNYNNSLILIFLLFLSLSKQGFIYFSLIYLKSEFYSEFLQLISNMKNKINNI